MRIIVAGSREFNDYEFLKSKLDEIVADENNVEIVCGMSKGADLLGKQYGEERNFCVHEYLAEWNNIEDKHPGEIKSNKNGRYWIRAGIVRNETMAQNADMLVAFRVNKSSGTSNLIELAKKYKLKTIVIDI